MTLALTAFRRWAAAWAWPAPGPRAGGPAWLTAVVGVYVELIRNTPFIVQLFFIFFGLPGLGVKLSPEIASVLAMVDQPRRLRGRDRARRHRDHAQGADRGGRSLALSESQVFTRVVLPPALERVWPALVSQIIIVMLGSAVCGQISARN